MMKKFLLSITLSIFIFGQAESQTFTQVLTDATGDGFDPGLLDGTELYYAFDTIKDSVFFQINVASMSHSQSMAIGVNIMFNIPGGGNTFNFWGNDNSNPFHKLLTVWVTGTPPSNYSGTIGMADAMGVNSSQYSNLINGQLGMNVSENGNYILIGIPRVNLLSDQEIGVGDSKTIGIAAAVGSNVVWNDDLYQAGSTITVYKEASGSIPTGISRVEDLTEINLFPNPTSDWLTVELSDVNKTYVLDIYDHAGRLTENFRLEQTTSLAVSHLDAGFYVAKLTDEDGQVYVQNLLIQ